MTRHDEVAAVIERWRAALAVRNAEGLLALWDRSFPRLRYLPTERPRFLTSWDEIHAYTERMCTGSAVQSLQISELTIDVLSDTEAFAFGYITQVSKAGHDERRWQGRVQFSLHRVGDEWLIIRYEDSTDLAEAGGFAVRLQAPKRTQLAAAIRAGDPDLALQLLDDLATPPPFGSAEAMDTIRQRQHGTP